VTLGQSGNPNRRPKGSCNTTTVALENLLDGQAQALTQKAIWSEPRKAGGRGGHGGDRHVLAAATTVSRLSRTFAILVETLRWRRSGGSQVIRIERVDVREGGQAVIGNIRQKRSHE